MNDMWYEIWAVVKRDMKKEHKPINYLIFFLGFFGVIFLVGFGFDSFVDFSRFGSSYTEFFSAGIIAYFIAISGLQVGNELIRDRKGFIRLLLVAPISKFSILFGKALSLLIGIFRIYFFMIVVFVLYFKTLKPLKLLFIVAYLIFITLIFLSFGIWFSSLFENPDTGEKVTGWLSFILLLLSGIFFPINALPSGVQKIFVINPMMYVVDLLRYLMIGDHLYPVLLDVIIIFVLGMISIILGTLFYDKNLRS